MKTLLSLSPHLALIGAVVGLLAASAWAQTAATPAETLPPAPTPAVAPAPIVESPSARDVATSPAGVLQHQAPWLALIGSVTVFTLAVFVGMEVISKVPPTLHTPLMSGSNAISGITVVGAIVVASIGFYQRDALDGGNGAASVLGAIAVAMASVNVVGGFMVTHRMLGMFQGRREA